MSLYILKDTTYEILPKKDEVFGKPDLTQDQFRRLALTLSEYFGCFMLFGMSYQGQPRLLASASSGMEYLALKKFAEDVVMGETGMEFASLDSDSSEIDVDDE